jgi:hypothetical protein
MGAVRFVMVHNGQSLAVRIDAQKFGRELLTLSDVHRNDPVLPVRFLQLMTVSPFAVSQK